MFGTILVSAFSLWPIFLHPFLLVFFQCMFPTFGFNMYTKLHCVHWQIGGEKTLFKITPGIQGSGHHSREKEE